MDSFAILEEKIKILVSRIKALQAETNELKLEREELLAKTNDLILENAKLVEENTEASRKLKEIECSQTKGNKELESLSEERELTKVAVDDLIKSIDVLVKNERQQSNEV